MALGRYKADYPYMASLMPAKQRRHFDFIQVDKSTRGPSRGKIVPTVPLSKTT